MGDVDWIRVAAASGVGGVVVSVLSGAFVVAVVSALLIVAAVAVFVVVAC